MLLTRGTLEAEIRLYIMPPMLTIITQTNPPAKNSGCASTSSGL